MLEEFQKSFERDLEVMEVSISKACQLEVKKRRFAFFK